MRKIMVLDCEYNQPSRKCIQIGAAVYDARTTACHGTLDIYVDPKETITEYITNLTGITDRDVQGAPNIIEAWGMLKNFHKKHDCIKNPLVWGSGVRNDSLALYQEYMTAYAEQEKELSAEENFMGWRVIDAKTLYQSFQIFENGQFAGGLSDSMKRLGLSFEGDKHRALTDARNTFTIWYYLTRKMHDGIQAKK